MPRSKCRPAGHIQDLGDGRWLVRTSHGIGAGGKRIRSQSIIEGQKKDAQRHLTSLLKRRDDGLSAALSRQTFGEWAEEWLKNWASNKGPRTRSDSEKLLGRLLRYEREFGGLRLSTLSANHIQQVVNRFRERGLSPRTVRMYHGLIRGCLARAERLGKVARNVAQLVELPPQTRTERLFLTAEQAERLLQTGVDDRFYALFALLTLTGLRPGEACALRWDDIDNRALRVRRAIVWLPNSAPIFAETNTRRSRVVTLGERVLGILKRQRAKQAEWRLKMGAAYEDQGLIFCNETGGPLHLRNVDSRHFKPLLRQAGLPKIRLYDLRHTHATLLLAAGEHPKVVQERLGHATITLTLDTYSHVVPGMQERAAERLDSLLEAASSAAGQR
jgi:integrase